MIAIILRLYTSFSPTATANRGSDWNVTQTKLQFSDTGRLTAVSDVPLTAVIVDDDVAEPRESFICNLQSGNADDIKAVPPTQITVSILDNDGIILTPDVQYIVLQYNCFLNLILNNPGQNWSSLGKGIFTDSEKANQLM